MKKLQLLLFMGLFANGAVFGSEIKLYAIRYHNYYKCTDNNHYVELSKNANPDGRMYKSNIVAEGPMLRTAVQNFVILECSGAYNKSGSIHFFNNVDGKDRLETFINNNLVGLPVTSRRTTRVDDEAGRQLLVLANANSLRTTTTDNAGRYTIQ